MEVLDKAKSSAQGVMQDPRVQTVIPAVQQGMAIAKDEGTNTQRAAARSLFNTEAGQRLLFDIQHNNQSGLIARTVLNNPQAIALAGQYSPFINETMRLTRNDQMNKKFISGRQQVITRAKQALNMMDMRGRYHATNAAALQKAAVEYAAISKNYTNPHDLVVELHRRGVKLEALPAQVQERLRTSLRNQEADKGASMAFMVNRWHTNAQSRNIRDIKKLRMSELQRIQAITARKQKATALVRQMHNIRFRGGQPMDSGKQVNLNPVINLMTGRTKSANVIDLLADTKKLSYRSLYDDAVHALEKKKESVGKRRDKRKKLASLYLNEVLAGDSNYSKKERLSNFSDRMIKLIEGDQ